MYFYVSLHVLLDIYVKIFHKIEYLLIKIMNTILLNIYRCCVSFSHCGLKKATRSQWQPSTKRFW